MLIPDPANNRWVCWSHHAVREVWDAPTLPDLLDLTAARLGI